MKILFALVSRDLPAELDISSK